MNQIAREFLNLPGHGGSAHIIANVSNTGPDAELIIGDCHRQITLDFTSWSPIVNRFLDMVDRRLQDAEEYHRQQQERLQTLALRRQDPPETQTPAS